MSVRIDLLGITSIVRAFGLQESCYDRILDFFHGSGLNLEKLTTIWTRTVLKIFPKVLRVNGRLLLVGDGIKIPKEGKKMPAVKGIHQESESNSKPSFIMGHSFQAVGILAGGLLNTVFAVPLVSRIHEGIVFSNRDKRTLLDKMAALTESLKIGEPFYFIADAYYATGKIVKNLLAKGNQKAMPWHTIRLWKKAQAVVGQKHMEKKSNSENYSTIRISWKQPQARFTVKQLPNSDFDQ